MRRIIALCLALSLLFLCLPAQGETQYPACMGTVTDLANVLGEEIVRDLDTLSQRLRDAADTGFYIVTRHFLGGQDVKAYADGLFQSWGLSGSDALLLLVIGEESYALSLGAEVKSLLPDETQISLLGTHLRGAYLNRDYDGALADFCLTFTEAVAKGKNVSVSAAGLLGREALRSTPAPGGINQLWMSMFGEKDMGEEEYHFEWEAEDDGISLRTIMIWALVIYFLFFRKKKKKKRILFR